MFLALKYVGYILYSVLLLLFVFSLLNLDFIKELGDMLVLVLGVGIWTGIFCIGYKIFKATGGDEEYLASKVLANTMGDIRKQDFKVKQKGDLTSSSHRTRESAINMTKQAKNECYIYYKGTSLGVWCKGEYIRPEQ